MSDHFSLLEWDLPGLQKGLFYDGKTPKSFLKCRGKARGRKTSLDHLHRFSPICHITQTLCLSSIYEDLKMYQVEFKAISAKLLMDPKRQITLDPNMLAAIDELMQVRPSSYQREHLLHAKTASRGP